MVYYSQLVILLNKIAKLHVNYENTSAWIHTMMSLLIPMLLSSLAWADPSFNLDDTGDLEDEYALEYTDLWPAKIVLDVGTKQCKLVWFETTPPRHTNVTFNTISSLKLIPQYEGYPNELQIHLTDGRSFLLDHGGQVRKTAQTFTALSKIVLEEGSYKDTRIIPKPIPTRSKPVLSVGSVDAPEALLPPSESTINTKSVVATTYNIDTTSFDYIVKSNMARFRQCYITNDASEPISGTIELQVQLQGDGNVSNVSIKSNTVHNSLVETCLMHQMKGLQFSKPKEGSEIETYPFILGQ